MVKTKQSNKKKKTIQHIKHKEHKPYKGSKRELEQQNILLANILQSLHANWMPFDAQKAILHKLFYELKSMIFIECGRKFGKTELLCYILWRFAISKPRAYCYYFTPHANQCREILWASRRIQEFGDVYFLDGKPNDTEMRVNFKNGSFIKLDGSDNYDRHRGTNPHIAVYDEFKDFRPEFHEIMDPNLATYKAPLIICGSPELTECQFINIAETAKKMNTAAYFNFPTWANPHIDRGWLKAKKEELYSRNDAVLWEREYGAKRVFGGARVIFPMFNDKTMILPHDRIQATIFRDRNKLEWYAVADPGTATCFAVLFVAINKYKKIVYLLDEVYETSQAETSTSKIIPRILKTKDDLRPDSDDWYQVCDEAATWFINEAWQSYGVPFVATTKALHKKEDGLSLIKDLMLMGKFFMSDRCVKTKWEIENYLRDKNGNIPKQNDHILDCLRYTLNAAAVSLSEDLEPVSNDDGYDKEALFNRVSLADDYDNIIFEEDF